MTSKPIYYYVYRITNTKLGKHYYGARTSKVEPKLDIGVKYFSSSHDKDFIADQAANPKNYKYKVVGIFQTRQLTVAREIKLHQKFNVKAHPKFYNRANQSSIGFDTSGIIITDKHRESLRHKKIPWTDARKLASSLQKKGKLFKPLTREQIAKSGIGHYKSCKIEGTIFESNKAACIGLNLTASTISKRCSSNKPQWSNWVYL